MPTSILSSADNLKTRRKIPLLERMGRRIVYGMLSKLVFGRLTVQEGDRVEHFGKRHKDDTLSATITIVDPHFFRATAFGGSVGAAESYIVGEWRCNDLVALIRIIIRNQQVLRHIDSGWSRAANAMNNGIHWLRRNTQRGSRDNIRAHYDLGNEFYGLFLDETMAYSCGIFEKDSATLKASSIAKFNRICQKLELCPDDNLLEIGTGWGGFAIHAARHYGCRVTTTTISQRQYDHARHAINEAGLDHRITLLKRDYRKLTGTYDKLVSIEMIEAVGHQYMDTFFQVCGERLKPGGLMLLQAITISDQAYETYKRSVDFINHYIFPGSCLPSVTAMTAATTRKTDMRLFHLEDITDHYATTLNHWRRRFWLNIEDVRRLGFPETFIRMWDYYLGYCEAGFLERHTGNVQMLLARPGYHPALPAIGATVPKAADE